MKEWWKNDGIMMNDEIMKWWDDADDDDEDDDDDDGDDDDDDRERERESLVQRTWCREHGVENYVLWRMWKLGWCMSGRWSKDWINWPQSFLKKTVAGTFGNVGPSAVLLLQTLLDRWFLEIVLRCDCTSQLVSRVGKTDQQTCLICCAFCEVSLFLAVGDILWVYFTKKNIQSPKK